MNEQIKFVDFLNENFDCIPFPSPPSTDARQFDWGSRWHVASHPPRKHVITFRNRSGKSAECSKRTENTEADPGSVQVGAGYHGAGGIGLFVFARKSNFVVCVCVRARVCVCVCVWRVCVTLIKDSGRRITAVGRTDANFFGRKLLHSDLVSVLLNVNFHKIRNWSTPRTVQKQRKNPS